MKWESVAPFGNVHYVSGIYKLTSYTHYKNRWVAKYWRAYYITPRAENWGGNVSRAIDMPTLAEAKEMCGIHAADYSPTKHQIMVAERSLAKLKEDQ